ncbi:MAG: 5-oxoprolinase/urea amidolyase family protein, partial [Steroidobacter sp.]
VLRFHSDTVIALTGGDIDATLDGEPVFMWAPVEVKAGQTLIVGRMKTGCRTYIAVRHGFDVPAYLGSRSTFVLGQFGGHAGRTLRQGDMLPLAAESEQQLPPQSPSVGLIPDYPSVWDIAVLYGPHGAPDFFTPAAIETLFAAEWEVHYNSNRLGVRLIGPKPSWTRSDGGEAGLHPSNIHDCEYAVGSINFTGDSPVILTRDGPSLGGFVCPITIAKAELWKVGQVRPGDKIKFRRISYEHAAALEALQDRHVETLQDAPPLAPFSLPAKPSTVSETVIAELLPTAHRPAVAYRQAGDNYLLLEYGENVLDLALRLRVHLLMEALRTQPIDGVEELSPGVRSLQIRYDSRRIRQDKLLQRLIDLEQHLADVSTLRVPTRIVHLPMAFEDSATLGAVQRYSETVRKSAPWLPNNVDFIQRINGLASRDEVRDIVFAARYMVLGLGDVYLGAPCAVPIDPRHRLMTSKYNPARTFTAEGTVGIGGVYMCIYGMDSPGGYQLVGRTLPIWNKFLKNETFEPGKPWLLRFFDQVQFHPVEEAELSELRDAFREGRARIRVEQETFDFAQHQRFLKDNAASIADFRARQKKAFDLEVTRWQAEDAPAATSTAEVVATVEEEIDGHMVTADMCGSVWKILVTPDQAVTAGQPLIIIEAMKMELTVAAPVAGRVKGIRCSLGKAVNTGDALVVLEA